MRCIGMCRAREQRDGLIPAAHEAQQRTVVLPMPFLGQGDSTQRELGSLGDIFKRIRVFSFSPQIAIVANLKPRKMRGIESNGMIVAASLDGGKPVLAGFHEDVPAGASLR